MSPESNDHRKRGILCKLEPKRAEEVEERIREVGQFTDGLSVHDFDLSGSDVLLLSFSPGELNYAAVGTRGQRVATAKAIVRFTHLVDLASLPCQEAVSRITGRLRRHGENALNGLGARIAEKSWLAMWDALLELRPGSAAHLNDLLSHRDNRTTR